VRLIFQSISREATMIILDFPVTLILKQTKIYKFTNYKNLQIIYWKRLIISEIFFSENNLKKTIINAKTFEMYNV